MTSELDARKMPVAQAVARLCSHGTNHTAQIRDMGLPAPRGLRLY